MLLTPLPLPKLMTVALNDIFGSGISLIRGARWGGGGGGRDLLKTILSSKYALEITVSQLFLQLLVAADG